MDSSQECYEQLLAFIEDPFDNFHPKFYPASPIIDDEGNYHGVFLHLKEPDLEKNMTNELQTIISNTLKSGIFRDGKLRGKKLSSKHLSYAINDFELTLITAAEYIDYSIKAKIINPLLDKFEWHYYELQDRLDHISEIIEKLGSSRLKKSLLKVRNNLSKLNSETKKKMPPTSNFTSLDSLIRLFKEKIPKAPDLTLSARLRELLKKFDFDIKAETIRKRLQSL
jgi:hypothetical protein